MDTIFDRIVTKENDHTNLLRNLMDRKARFGAAIVGEIMGRPITEFESTTLLFHTQQPSFSIDGREIPDIVVTGDRIHCIIEAKVDPYLALTVAQRGGYRNCFPKSGERCLAFLVPDDWKHSNDIDVIRLECEPEISVRRLSWKRLLEIGDRLSEDQPDAVLSEALQFWKWRFESTLMTAEERSVLVGWSTATYKAIRKLEKTVDQAKKIFETRGFTAELEADRVEYYGFYVKNEGRILLWVGIWTDAKAPLAYGYDFHDRPTWTRPFEKPANPNTTTKDYYLWELASDCWDKPEGIYRDVSAFLNKYWGLAKEA